MLCCASYVVSGCVLLSNCLHYICFYDKNLVDNFPQIVCMHFNKILPSNILQAFQAVLQKSYRRKNRRGPENIVS
jgi:hypothetical protein